MLVVSPLYSGVKKYRNFCLQIAQTPVGSAARHNLVLRGLIR